jgi:hypothetical protein
MKSVVLLLVCLITPALAGETSDAFLERALSKGRSHNLAQWQSLYCEGQTLTRAEEQRVQFFTSAKILGPIHSSTKEIEGKLLACFEKPSQKEMCVQIPVARKGESLCLLTAVPSNKPLKNDARKNARAS